jgi:hypothetical protein
VQGCIVGRGLRDTCNRSKRRIGEGCHDGSDIGHGIDTKKGSMETVGRRAIGAAGGRMEEGMKDGRMEGWKDGRKEGLIVLKHFY